MKQEMKQNKYEITKSNVLEHEMIGLQAKVIKSSDKSREGIEGKIVDETQFTFSLLGKHLSGKKAVEEEFVIPKKECEIEFDLENEKVIVKGNDILKRPEDRVKDWKK